MADTDNSSSETPDDETLPDSDSTSDLTQSEYDEKLEEDEGEVEFHPHKGKIMGMKQYSQISSISWDKSYDNPTGTSNVKIHYSDDELAEALKYIYKGVSCKAKLRRSTDSEFSTTGIEEYGLSEEQIVEREHYPTEEQLEDIGALKAQEDLLNHDLEQSERENAEEDAKETEPYPRSDVDAGVYGFVTDVSHDDNSTELEINDWGYCLEDNTKKLSFNNMLRSQILEEVIKSYGLVPVVDFTGLRNDVISWSNVTSGGGGTSSESVGDASDGRDQCSPVYEVLSINQNDGGGTPVNELMQGFSPNADALGKIGVADSNYGKAVQGKSPKEAYKTIKSGWTYCCYENNRDNCATESWDKRGSPGINCGDSARLLKCCMDVVGCPCVILHVTGHYMNAVKVDGQWKTADLCYSSGRHPEYNTAGFNK